MRWLSDTLPLQLFCFFPFLLPPPHSSLVDTVTYNSEVNEYSCSTGPNPPRDFIALFVAAAGPAACEVPGLTGESVVGSVEKFSI